MTILNGFYPFCSGLQRGGRPVASGCESCQWALRRVDAAGHPAVLHRLQTTGPAQHEMETATGSSSSPPPPLQPLEEFINWHFFPPTALFSPPRLLYFLRRHRLHAHLNKWVSSIYLLFSRLPGCFRVYDLSLSPSVSLLAAARWVLSVSRAHRGAGVIPLPV